MDRPTMVLAVPSTAGGGLEAVRADHFGRCDCFTIVDIVDGEVGAVRVVQNPPHVEGGCLRPVELLAGEGVGALIVSGIGASPLAGFNEAGIDVYFDSELPMVYQVVGAVRSGNASRIAVDNACGGCP